MSANTGLLFFVTMYVCLDEETWDSIRQKTTPKSLTDDLAMTLMP